MRSFGNRRRHADESGFTLTELVVAMAIFTVFCSASLGLLVRTGDATRVNLNRTAAANLASQQVQLARALDAVDIPLGTVTSSQTVGNTAYTIKQTSKYLTGDINASVCSSTSATLAYKLVTVKVSWPGATSGQVVRQDTLKAVGIKATGLDSTGVLALLVTTASGVTLPDIPITLNDGSTASTDDSGCAVFVGLSPGSYTATLNVLGYTGLSNAQQTVKSGLGVSVGAVGRSQISYDTTRNLVVSVTSPVTNGVIPSGLPIQLSSGALSGTLNTLTGYPACPGSGTPTTACATAPTATASGQAGGLFPAIYTVKLGACTESSASQNVVDLTSSSAGSTVSVPLGAITVNLTKAGVAYTGTKTVTVTHSGVNTGCLTGETYTFPATANGTRILVPYGAWNVTVPTTTSATPTSTQAVTLSSSSTAAGTNFVVTS